MLLLWLFVLLWLLTLLKLRPHVSLHSLRENGSCRVSRHQQLLFFLSLRLRRFLPLLRLLLLLLVTLSLLQAPFLLLLKTLPSLLLLP